MKCPFCQQYSIYGEAKAGVVIRHVLKHHCSDEHCFCGAYLGDHIKAGDNVTQLLGYEDLEVEWLKRHLKKHGGLQHHAYDFLMGVKDATT